MLPPGHIAGGYIVSEIVLHNLNYSFSYHEANLLLLVGIFFSFAPDLDFFAAFAKTKSLKIDNNVAPHRKFFSHAPLLWLVIGLLTFLINSDPFYKTVGIMIWAGTWTHFILDSEWGIMWLWPFSKKYFPFSEAYYQRKYTQGQDVDKNLGFWKYWLEVARVEYFKRHGFLEIILIVIALTIALNK